MEKYNSKKISEKYILYLQLNYHCQWKVIWKKQIKHF